MVPSIILEIIFVTVVFNALLTEVHSQMTIGDICILKVTGIEGRCKLISDCPKAIEDLQKNKIIPQTCGFQKSTPIICCIKDHPQLEPQKKQERPPSGQISKEKCKEYSKYSFRIEKQVTEVVGGELVEVLEFGAEFPHMAIIGYGETSQEVKWLCGGTIISEQYILTAAHCLISPEFGPAKWVRVGVIDLENTTEHEQRIAVAERIAHPDYRSNSHYNDIGLIKMEKQFALNPYVKPACLYTSSQINEKEAIATGWGNTIYGGNGSEQLRKVTLDLFDHSFCNQFYTNQLRRLKKGILDDSQVCAGSKTNKEKDTCQGDSGGPLQIYHVSNDLKCQKCMYDIIGVTSFGKACSGNSGVYTRVSYYIKWIEDIVWP